MTEDQTLMSEDDERASPSDLGGDTKPRGCAVAGEYVSPFPDQVLENVLENVLLFLTSRRDRNAVSLVCKSWYRAEALTRSELFIGNCYAVAPRRVTERFRQVRAVTLKGKPRFADFNLMPHNWGAHFAPWVTAMGYHYRALEKLCLKRMSVKDEDLELLADSFPYFKELVLVCCDGFGTSGLAVIANNCRDLQSYLSHLSLFLAPESKKFYILVDNRPWLKDLGPRSAHLWQLMVTKAPNYTSPDYRNIDLGSSSKCNNKMTMRPPIANTTQERAVNRTPEKRQRVPSAYNQFIKEEIQRIKANNPDISHREAFSTAAKNMKRKYRIATPSTLSDKRRNLSGLLLEGRQRTSPKIDKDDINNLTKAQVDLELARMRSMNPQEAAVAAAQAVAEAEAEYNFCCGTEVVGVQFFF